MVSVAVCAVVPEMVTDDGMVQEGASLGLEMLVVTRQLRLMVPVNPFTGDRVMVPVPEVPGVTVTVPLLLAVKLGVLTFTLTALLIEILPEAPLTVAV